jgi:mRNA interferase RelE/StbE
VTYRVTLRPSARRALTDELPEPVAAAVVEFIYGPLAENPHRLGKALRAPFEGRHSARRGAYRIIYRIVDHELVIDVIKIEHRATAYR